MTTEEEELAAALALSLNQSINLNSTPNSSMESNSNEKKAALKSQLSELGYSEEQINRAIEATNAESVDSAVAWILQQEDQSTSQIALNLEALQEPVSTSHRVVQNRQCKLVLVVRKGLNMGTGKIASQCSHATLAVYKKLLSTRDMMMKMLVRCWEAEGEPTIVLGLPGGNEKDMYSLSSTSTHTVLGLNFNRKRMQEELKLRAVLSLVWAFLVRVTRLLEILKYDRSCSFSGLSDWSLETLLSQHIKSHDKFLFRISAHKHSRELNFVTLMVVRKLKED